MAAAAATLLVVLALVAFFALRPTDDAPTAEPFDITGKVRLTSDMVETSGLPEGYKCAGSKEFGDVGPNAPIIVEDETGRLLAKGSIGGSSSSRDECLLKFVVNEVPAGSRFYRVQVGQQQEMSFTEEEARAGVEFMMGATEPDPGTTVASPPKPPPTRTVTATPTPDLEQQSLARLQAMARDDRAFVSAVLADKWIPQISSKRVGLVAQGITWDNQAILNEHLRLRNSYQDVKLLWSGDWSTYDYPNFWVTVVGLWSTNDDPYDVLSWCTEQGFDRDNCIAKIVSTTHPIAGSTKLNPPIAALRWRCGSVSDQVGELIEIDGGSGERLCEVGVADTVPDGQPAEAQCCRLQRRDVFHRVVQRPLFPPGRSGSVERPRCIGRSEHRLAGGVCPPLPPLAGREALGFSVPTVREIGVMPWQVGSPGRLQCSRPIAVEVQLLVEFHN